MEPIASDVPKKPGLPEERLRRRIALEWIYLLGSLAIGLTVFPAALMLVFGNGLRFGLFYEAILNGTGNARVVVAAPYVGFQLVRSIVWAVRAARTP